MTEFRLEAAHTHLFPGAKGRITGALPAIGVSNAATCPVIFSDGSMALGSLARTRDSEGMLEVGAYTTAAGTEIPAKRWRIEFSKDGAGFRRFRVRARTQTP